MKVSATIKNEYGYNEVLVKTNDSIKEMHIPAKSTGYGSSINGGELLLLSLAACFCNDIYREASKRNLNISNVEVEVTGEFGSEGDPGTNFNYRANVISDSPESEIKALIRHTDQVAEIHNTLRKGLSVNLID